MCHCEGSGRSANAPLTAIWTSTHLQQRLKLGDNVIRRSLLLELPQAHVGANDLGELVGQIVLSTHGSSVDSDGRANRWWRDGKAGEDHPSGVRLELRETENLEVLGRHLAEEGVDHGRREHLAVGLHHVAVLRASEKDASAQPFPSLIAEQPTHLVLALAIHHPKL